MPKYPRIGGEECWGFCDYRKRELVIAKQARKAGVSREILLHETVHKLCPFFTESVVDYIAKELDLMLDLAESHGIVEL